MLINQSTSTFDFVIKVKLARTMSKNVNTLHRLLDMILLLFRFYLIFQLLVITFLCPSYQFEILAYAGTSGFKYVIRSILKYNLSFYTLHSCRARKCSPIVLPNVVRPCCREAAALRGARHRVLWLYLL